MTKVEKIPVIPSGFSRTMRGMSLLEAMLALTVIATMIAIVAVVFQEDREEKLRRQEIAEQELLEKQAQFRRDHIARLNAETYDADGLIAVDETETVQAALPAAEADTPLPKHLAAAVENAFPQQAGIIPAQPKPSAPTLTQVQTSSSPDVLPLFQLQDAPAKKGEPQLADVLF